jgi:hypothetical protein
MIPTGLNVLWHLALYFNKKHYLPKVPAEIIA